MFEWMHDFHADMEQEFRRQMEIPLRRVVLKYGQLHLEHLHGTNAKGTVICETMHGRGCAVVVWDGGHKPYMVNVTALAPETMTPACGRSVEIDHNGDRLTCRRCGYTLLRHPWMSENDWIIRWPAMLAQHGIPEDSARVRRK